MSQNEDPKSHIHEIIKPFPLRFVDQKLEDSYKTYLNTSFQRRCVATGILILLSSAAYWSVRISTLEMEDFNFNRVFVVFYALMATSVLAISLLSLVGYIPYFKSYPEVSCIVLASVITMSTLIQSVYVSFTMRYSKDVCAITLIVFFVLVVSTLIPIRWKIGIIFYVIASTSVLSLFLMHALVFETESNDVLVWTFTFVVSFGMIIVCLFGAHHLEQQHRAVYCACLVPNHYKKITPGQYCDFRTISELAYCIPIRTENAGNEDMYEGSAAVKIATKQCVLESWGVDQIESSDINGLKSCWLDRQSDKTAAIMHELNITCAKCTNIGFEWNLDIMSLLEGLPPIVTIGGALLAPLIESVGEVATSRRLKCPPAVLKTFLQSLELGYYDTNPYHNAVHAAQVAHSSMWLYHYTGLNSGFSALDEFAFVVAALGHDVDHKGRNNQYLVNSRHQLAVRYNDVSVLEMHHAAITFDLLHKHRVLDSLADDQYKNIRKLIIDLILATDMKGHYDLIEQYVRRSNNPEFDFKQDPEDKRLVAKLYIKAGDLSHGALGWKQHHLWSLRVSQEFLAQGRQESEEGLPVSALGDPKLNTPNNLAKSQIGFLNFVVLPLFVVFKDRLDVSNKIEDECTKRIHLNLEMWRTKMLDESVPHTLPNTHTKTHIHTQPHKQPHTQAHTHTHAGTPSHSLKFEKDVEADSENPVSDGIKHTHTYTNTHTHTAELYETDDDCSSVSEWTPNELIGVCVERDFDLYI